MQPWIDAMFAVDEAEARGDAMGALAIMDSCATGPNGEYFWRPERLARLMQIVLFGPELPGWVTSRWILDQAQHALHEGRRRMASRAEAVAVEARGGPAALPGADEIDAKARVHDRDWIYRQLVLYEFGGLDHFLRHQATPDLVAGADRIEEWMRARMGGYRLVTAADPTVTTWRDLQSGADLTGPNIGSAALIQDGDHVIGRLVATEAGHIFETQPLYVPVDLATAVSKQPDEWLSFLREALASTSGQDITTDGAHHRCFVSDVPPIVWQLAVDDCSGGMLTASPDVPPGALIGNAVLTAVRHALRTMRGVRPPGAADVWPCLGAAMMTPYVLTGLAEVAKPSDGQTLLELTEVLAEPAASACRGIAEDLTDAA